MTKMLSGCALPCSWILSTIGTIADVKGGKRLPKGSEYSKVPTSHPYIRVTDFENLTVNTTNLQFIESRIHKHISRYTISKDDVYISIAGSIGKVGLIPEALDGANLTENAAKITNLQQVDKRYLCYYLITQQARQQIALLTTASNQPKLALFRIETIELPLAPLNEQHRIVDAIETQFTRLDAAVSALKRTQANLKRYRAAVLKAACEGRLVPTEAELARAEGRSYEPASALQARILVERRRKWEADTWQKEVDKAKQKAAKVQRQAAGRPLKRGEKLEPAEWQSVTEDVYGRYLPKYDNWKEKYQEPEPPDLSNLSVLPEGWVWVRLEQLADISGGLTKNSKRNSLPIQMPYLRVANVYADRLALEDVHTIGVTDSEVDRVMLMKGDLLIVEGNGSPEQIGRVAVWDNSIAPCLHQNHLIKARFIQLPVVMYVRYWLLSTGGRDNIKRVASSTSGLYTLSLSKVSDLAVPLPPLAEQQRIVAEVERRLSIADQLEKTVEADLARAERLRQSILKRAFEGKLAPQDPNDEPASVLLERIQNMKMTDKVM